MTQRDPTITPPGCELDPSSDLPLSEYIKATFKRLITAWVTEVSQKRRTHPGTDKHLVFRLHDFVDNTTTLKDLRRRIEAFAADGYVNTNYNRIYFDEALKRLCNNLIEIHKIPSPERNVLAIEARINGIKHLIGKIGEKKE